MNTYIPFILLAIGGSILTVGDIFMKERVIKNTNVLFFSGLAIYIVGLIFLAYSFKYKNIAVASTMFVIFNIITLSVVSRIFFHETLTPMQIL